jgi:hypothetical protein
MIYHSLSSTDWDWSLDGLLAMTIIGVFSFFGMMLTVIGYQFGDATKVAWMEYSLDICIHVSIAHI